MPTGRNLARCRTCGKEWIVGDCIPSECHECECARRGHHWISNFCGRCGARWKPEISGNDIADEIEREQLEGFNTVAT